MTNLLQLLATCYSVATPVLNRHRNRRRQHTLLRNKPGGTNEGYPAQPGLIGESVGE